MNRTAATLSLIAATFALTACKEGASNTTTTSTTTANASGGAAAAPAGNALSSRVTATRDGVLIGDPNARLKIVEYASPTCPACAAFSTTGSEPLKREFIDTGRANLEIRPFVIHGPDPIIAAVLDCAGTDRFVPLLENVFASHEELMTNVQAGGAAAQAALSRPPAERMAAITSAFGIDRFFAARGIPADQVRQCVSDQAKIERWVEATNRNAQADGVPGTPTFLLNGELLQGVGTWDKLREALVAASS